MTKKIFLADDSITIQKVVELTFSEGDYEVTCVGNGAAALQRLPETAPDIALLDVIMPERSGYEICAHIKKSKDLGWMPVLLLTGAFESYDEKRARDAGADGHMTKPFESRALVASVEKLLAEHPRPGAPAAPPRAAAPSAPSPMPTPVPAPSASSPALASSPVMRPRTAAPAAPAPPAAATPTVATPTVATPTMVTPSAVPRAAAPAPPAPMPGAAPVAVPQEAIERAVKEMVAGLSEKIVRETVGAISEKIVREVAWEVIPDLAEAIVRRRIRELEDEAAR